MDRNVWERFHLAILLLAQGDGLARKRLVSAYIDNIRFIEPENPGVPKEIRDSLRRLKENISWGGSVEDTVAAMNDNEIHELIERLVDMYDTVTRYQEPLKR